MGVRGPRTVIAPAVLRLFYGMRLARGLARSVNLHVGCRLKAELMRVAS